MYTIQILKGGSAKLESVHAALQAAIEKDGRFRVSQWIVGSERTSREDRRLIGQMLPVRVSTDMYVLPTLFLAKVRLTHRKPYCGNHPGPCQVNPFLGPQRKPNATYLEWDDWVQFHALVNRVLNRLRCHANVWTRPQDVNGKMWIRKNLSARRRWDYEESYVPGIDRSIRIWNTGTPDQFEAP